jgi:hypothetical protein
VIVILVQTEDATAADRVVNCVDEINGCSVVVIDNGVVTRSAPTTSDGGSA